MSETVLSSIDYRHCCTAADPWTRDKSFFGDHPDAVEVSRQPYEGYEASTHDCPHCGLRFRMWWDVVNPAENPSKE